MTILDSDFTISPFFGVYYNAYITVKPVFLVNIWDVAHWDTKLGIIIRKCTISGPLVNLGI